MLLRLLESIQGILRLESAPVTANYHGLVASTATSPFTKESFEGIVRLVWSTVATILSLAFGVNVRTKLRHKTKGAFRAVGMCCTLK